MRVRATVAIGLNPMFDYPRAVKCGVVTGPSSPVTDVLGGYFAKDYLSVSARENAPLLHVSALGL